jgi:hypothetical protein
VTACKRNRIYDDGKERDRDGKGTLDAVDIVKLSRKIRKGYHIIQGCFPVHTAHQILLSFKDAIESEQHVF